MRGITRADVAGALKVLNAIKQGGRKEALRAMLLVAHSPKEAEKALADVEGYPEWAAGAGLETAPEAPAVDAPVAAAKKPRAKAKKPAVKAKKK